MTIKLYNEILTKNLSAKIIGKANFWIGIDGHPRCLPGLFWQELSIYMYVGLVVNLCKEIKANEKKPIDCFMWLHLSNMC